MSFRLGALVLILAIGVAGRAGAEEVTLGMIGSMRWDTAAYVDNGSRVNAWRGGVGPRVRVRREKAGLRFDARYQALYERTVDGQARDTWDHLGRLSGAWNLSPRTTLDFSDEFVSQERPVFFSSASDPGDLPGADDADNDLNRTTRNLATVTLTHRLDPRWALVGVVSHSYVDSSTSRRFDSTAVNGQLFTSYAWSPRTTLDMGGVLSYTSIDGTDLQSGSRTRSVQIFGGWTYRPEPSIQFNLRGGPTFVRTKSKRSDTSGLSAPRFRPIGFPPNGEAYALDSCFQLQGTPIFGVFGGGAAAAGCSDRVVSGVNGESLEEIGVDNEEFTTISGGNLDEETLSFFGEASISKQWRSVVARLAYRRTQSPSTQSGGATSLDRVSGVIEYAPPGPWLFRFAADWSLRQSLSDVQVNGAEGFDSDIFFETAADSGLTGLDTSGNVRSIAQAGSIVTRNVSDAVKTYQWSLLFRIQRRIDRNGRVALDLRYRRVNQKGNLGRQGNEGRFVAALRFEYDLDPFEF
jgi:hypothetical protein